MFIIKELVVGRGFELLIFMVLSDSNKTITGNGSRVAKPIAQWRYTVV
mgnify:CR=1 FL=1